MSCNHVNPAGYQFCGRCAEPIDAPRCRCGFVGVAGDLFCGRCGVSLAAPQRTGTPVADAEQRFDLAYLAQQAAQESQLLDTAAKTSVTQEDIQRLIAERRKKA